MGVSASGALHVQGHVMGSNPLNNVGQGSTARVWRAHMFADRSRVGLRVHCSHGMHLGLLTCVCHSFTDARRYCAENSARRWTR